MAVNQSRRGSRRGSASRQGSQQQTIQAAIKAMNDEVHNGEKPKKSNFNKKNLRRRTAIIATDIEVSSDGSLRRANDDAVKITISSIDNSPKQTTETVQTLPSPKNDAVPVVLSKFAKTITVAKLDQIPQQEQTVTQIVNDPVL